MLFQRPTDDILYSALMARDPSYEGRAYVGVSSTGIFCRLTCPARKPKRENCQFFERVADCLEAGFRPCKRCHPLTPAADQDGLIMALIQALEEDPTRRWLEKDVIAMGYDPSTVRRSFKRHFGLTFLEMARMYRLRQGFTTLSEGGQVIEAQLDAGFSSSSAFREAFAKLMGFRPSDFRKDSALKADWIETPLGDMVAVTDRTHLHLLEFMDRKALPTELKKLNHAAKGELGFGRWETTDQIEAELKPFFAGQADHFETPIVMHGTEFTKTVWRALQTIPAGETRSYRDIAEQIQKPTGMRAVARANGANQIAIVIPCHRVIGADGTLTGYGGGLWRKQKLIDLEHKIAHQHAHIDPAR